MGEWIKISRNRQRFFRNDKEKQAFFAPKENFHSVHQDTIDATWHHAANKMYDSKSEFRRATKAAGCIEIGNVGDCMPKTPDWSVNEYDIAEAVQRGVNIVYG